MYNIYIYRSIYREDIVSVMCSVYFFTKPYIHYWYIMCVVWYLYVQQKFNVIPKIKILFPSDIFHQKEYQSFGGYMISQHFAIHCDAKITRVQHVCRHAGAGFWCNNRCNAFPHLSRSNSVNHDVLRPEMFSTNRLCDHGVDATTWFAHMRLHQVLMHLQTSLCCVFQKNL